MTTNNEKRVTRNNLSIDILEDSNNINNYIKSKTQIDDEDSFYILDLAKVVKKFIQWRNSFPNVEIFYAVKCFNNPVLLKLLAELGCGFDCASIGEINQILEITNINKDKIIYAHPCKIINHLEQANKLQVIKTTFDSIEELEKIKIYHPFADLILRIKTYDDNSLISFSKKFGADESIWENLIIKCIQLNLNLVGVSFHVGTGSYDISTFSRAIEDASKIFKIASDYGLNLSILDIGGGFPGIDSAEPSFEEFAQTINKSIEKHFGDKINLKVIGEPGRFFAEECLYIVTKVVSRQVWDQESLSKEQEKIKVILNRNDSFYENECLEIPKYFIKESTALSFSNAIFEERSYFPKLVEDHINESLYISNVYGISGCKNELISVNVELPILKINEYIYFENMGAYSTSIANGMSYNGYIISSLIFYCWSKNTLANSEENFENYLNNL